MVLKKDRTYRLCAVFTALNKIPKIQKHALRNLNAFSSSGCCCFLCLDIKDDRRRRRHSEEHPLQVRHKQDWAREFILLLPQALYCPDQMLAAMLLSQNRVSLFKTLRLCAPFGARCMGHAIKTWSAFCSEAMHF